MSTNILALISIGSFLIGIFWEEDNLEEYSNWKKWGHKENQEILKNHCTDPNFIQNITQSW